MEIIKRNELLHFSRLESRSEVLVLDVPKRAELVENALSYLYRLNEKDEREKTLALVETIMKDGNEVADHFKTVAYTVCDRHLTISYVNPAFLKRSGIDSEQVLGSSLYYQREYEGTEIERLYSMVMETRLLADALIRYRNRSAGAEEYDGWFVLVVIPLDEGGIGVLSKFSKTREEILERDTDLTSPDAPRIISI